ncbi:hypothetical protein HSX10_07310 [Winogradskyella undariae]|uniref:hypothetical protein n=1 Tax=Winogradskyella undariae TaxID=1285465 RepID=UPI00156AD6CD|nr:hypothetical protein [Winogradskyella undariae]NRR91368.1 hypothetical protein [Winogradskyella undariae]
MFWEKLKAGALQITLFIAVIIALLLTAFVLLVQAHKQFGIQTDFIIETSKNSNKGISYSLKNHIPLNDTTYIDLKDEDYKRLKVHREFWGIFEKITVVSEIKNYNLKKTVLIGGRQPEDNRVALFAQDNNRPLVLVGNTKIKGVAYLPERGVKSGNISGQSYDGSQLIYGQTKPSSKLPNLFNETITQINTIENEILKIEQEDFLILSDGKTYKNSFLRPEQMVYSNSEIRLNRVRLIGNIIVQSKTKIVVESSSVLNDIVLIAPEIEVENYVKGNFQAIASESLVIGENVDLSYPSALVLNEKMNEQEKLMSSGFNNKNLVINTNSNISGIVLYLGMPKTNNYNVQLELKENTVVIGEVYCNQNLELRGQVLGTVFANNFIVKQSGSIYQSHIYNGTINVDKLPQQYIGFSFNNSKKGEVKWLY